MNADAKPFHPQLDRFVVRQANQVWHVFDRMKWEPVWSYPLSELGFAREHAADLNKVIQLKKER